MTDTLERPPQRDVDRENSWLFDVSGMDCGDCARTIEAGVRRLPGVEAASVNFGAGTLTVVPSGESTTPLAVVSAVAQAGYRAAPRGTAEPAPASWWRERRMIEIGLAALLWAVGFALDRSGASTFAIALPYLLAMALAGYPVIRAAWFALRLRRADMNLLMAAAAIGALPLGEWEEGSSVLILFAIGLLLQSRTVQRTRRAISNLMRSAPDEATLLRDGAEQRVPAASLVAGDRIRVRPGDRIAADGEVVTGRSDVDQAAITGESIPVAAEPGSRVFAGTINGGGALDVVVAKPVSESTLAGIIHLVEEAQASRAPAQAFVDRFAAIYTPIVVAAAVTLSVAGALVTGDARDWIFRGLVLLVVACPCALVISTPVALVSAIGSAARRGVLFKGGSTIEALADVRTVAFDKTGTLTHGRPTVTRIIALNGGSEDQVLASAAAVESGATHPIARGIERAARDRGLAVPPAIDFRSLPGRGATARVDGATVTVGNPGLVDADPDIVAGLERAGETVVAVQRDDVPVGLIGLTDAPRQASSGAVDELHALGLATVMLSGDHRRAAEQIGRAVGVDDVRAELLPAGKVAAVEGFAGSGGVAMVGDGINDAPALAAASVGIAMGVAGSDVALDAAGVALLGDDLRQLPFAIRLSRDTMRIIRQNIAVSILVKIAFLGLTMAGVTNLWLAVAADMGTSLLVTLNALRLLRPSVRAK